MARNRPTSAGRRRTRRRRWPWIFPAGAAALVLWTWIGWPDVDAVASGPIRTSAFIAATAGATQRWVPYEKIDIDVKIAVLASEDTRFFQHNGIDTHELSEALKDAAFGDGLRGASTITQQVAKNLWLSPRRSFLRKLEEAALAWQLERVASKRRILEIYLNIAEFGPKTYGVEAASQKYFGHAASSLSARESAKLAAGLPRSTWYPGVDSRAYEEAVVRIELRMAKMAWLAKRL